VDSYHEEDSFLLSDIKYIIISEVNSKNFILMVNKKPTYYLASKRRDDIINIVKMLYLKHTKSNINIYIVPQNNLSEYKVNKRDSRKGNYEPPDSEYLENGEK